MVQFRSLLGGGLFLCLAAFVTGCGGGAKKQEFENSLTGKVLLNGQPAASVTIEVITPTGQKFSAVTARDGKFAITRVEFEGELKVAIKSSANALAAEKGSGGMPEMGKVPPEFAGQMKEKMAAMKQNAGAQGGNVPMVPSGAGGGTTVPSKYADPKTSGLTWTVSADKTTRTKDFNLTE
jgi:hypothetical protein